MFWSRYSGTSETNMILCAPKRLTMTRDCNSMAVRLFAILKITTTSCCLRMPVSRLLPAFYFSNWVTFQSLKSTSTMVDGDSRSQAWNAIASAEYWSRNLTPHRNQQQLKRVTPSPQHRKKGKSTTCPWRIDQLVVFERKHKATSRTILPGRSFECVLE